MTMGRGRIVRNGHPMESLTLASAQTQPATPESDRIGRGHIVRRERVEVAQEAARVLSAARAQAATLIRTAEQEAERIRGEARAKGLEEGSAQLAASWLAFQKREAQTDQAALDRSVTIGRLLAERLIGESLRLDPDLVAEIAREAMLHLWRSRRVTIHAHPDDVAALERQCATFGMPPERIVIVPDGERSPGSLRFTSDFGELDGELGPQLDRLAEAIRQELGAG
jgi:flagellar biosynthesis/type III secretory pathway protein FliH